jgi:molybdopterin-guanine dinucleotide biosynthesis protein A
MIPKMLDGMALKITYPVSGLYGLVLSGGKSSRMGTDKGMLLYHDKPQSYHVYEMLGSFCERVFISCRADQLAAIPGDYKSLADLPVYKNTGPMGALLTAFTAFPGKSFLLIGCDYPYLTETDIREFLSIAIPAGTSAAFYNASHELFEPVLAMYHPRSAAGLFDSYANGEHSLQGFLRSIDATRFYPANEQSMVSVDSRVDFINATSVKNGN